MEQFSIDNIEKEIRSLVAGILEIDEAKISPAARFVEELGMDSMMALEILASLEKKYNIKIPETYLTKVTCINSVAEIVRELINKA